MFVVYLWNNRHPRKVEGYKSHDLHRWMMYVKQEKRLNLKCICCILVISWKDKVPNTEIQSCTGLTTMFTLLRHWRLQWLDHVQLYLASTLKVFLKNITNHWNWFSPPIFYVYIGFKTWIVLKYWGTIRNLKNTLTFED